MPKEVPYYDSQATAAAALKIDIYELRELKSTGRCPEAFQSGRVYKGPLLKWLASRRRRQAAKNSNSPCDETTRRRSAVANAMIALAQCANAGVLTDEQYFKLGITIAEASTDEEILKQWIQVLFDFLSENFSELSDARKAHPRIVRWLCRQAGVK
jgi:hypothetical protein